MRFFKRLWSDKYVRILVILFLVMTPIFLTPVIYGYDGNGYYMYLRSLVIDGDLDLENESEYAKEQYDYFNIMTHPETGKVYNQYTVGVPLLWSPFFLVGHGLALVFAGEADGYSLWYTYATMLGSALFVLVGLLLVYHITKTMIKKKFAFFGVLIFWLSSHVFYYGFLQPSMSHAASFMMVALMLSWWYFKLKDEPTLRSWIVFGLITGVAFLVRMQTILYLTIPALFFIRDVIKARRDRLQLFVGPIAAAGTAFVTLIPQFLLWKYYTGHFIAAFSNYGLEPEKTFKFVNLFHVLFSNRHGLFVWTPVFLLGAIGLFLLWKQQKKQRLFVASLVLAAFLQLMVTATWRNWWSGFAFGNRYMLSTAVVFMIGFAYFLQVVSKRKDWLLYTLGFLLILWNWNLMLQYGTRIICGDCAASPLEIIKNTKELMPKLVEIAKTFLFSRNSLL